MDVKPDPNKSTDGLRDLIGCDWVEPVIVDENLTLWLDEERRLNLPQPGFALNGIPVAFAGNSVLLGGAADCVNAYRAAAVINLGVTRLDTDAVRPP